MTASYQDMAGDIPKAAKERLSEKQGIHKVVEPPVSVQETPEEVLSSIQANSTTTPPIKTVSIENDALAYEFDIYDSAETELAFIFVLDPKSFKIQPKSDTKFTLNLDGVEHKVYYIGRPIFFSHFKLHQIIFLKDLDNE